MIQDHKIPKEVDSKWFQNLKNHSSTTLRLFCFPYAGGSSMLYQNWNCDGNPNIEVCPILLPGRGKRLHETRYTDLLMLVEDMGTALLPNLETPFIFFGHSMGALISYELSRWLRRHRQAEPERLFVSGHRAPHLPPNNLSMHDLPDEDFIDELRKLEGTPPEVLQNKELIHFLLPLLRDDLSICENYFYKDENPLECPITVFGGYDDPIAPFEQLLPWRKLTNGDFEIQMFKGGHFFIRQEYQQIQKKIIKYF